MAPERLHNYLKTKIRNILQKSHAIPRSEFKHLLAHLSNHLLQNNKLFDHRHTHTKRVSYAQYIKQMHELNMSPIPK